MFQRQLAVFEAELELSSGIGPMENDECQIDLAIFETFVNALLAQHRRQSHVIVLALSESFTATVLVLAERARIRVDLAQLGATLEGPLSDMQASTGEGMSAPAEGRTWWEALREKAQELGRCMPR